MTKFLIALAACLCLGVSEAKAADSVFDIGYSSYMTTGFRCSTGTVSVAINASRPTGFTSNVMGYRIGNIDSADSVWIGGPSVSTATANGDSLTNLGVAVAAGASAPFPLGKAYGTAGVPLVPLYCRAADAAGAAGVVISVEWFGN